jgi:hypothetical protein
MAAPSREIARSVKFICPMLRRCGNLRNLARFPLRSEALRCHYSQKPDNAMRAEA